MADTTISLTAVTPTTVDRTDLLARLRVELHDEDSSNYRWTDATLQRHLERAVRELSQVWPRERKSTLTTTADSRDIAASFEGNLVRIEAVEWPVDQDPPQYVQWSYYGTTLTLLGENVPAGAESVYVFWGQLHTLDDSQSTLPAVAEDTVVLGAAGYAAIEWSNFATNRANVAGAQAADDYRDWGEAQLRRFRDQLSDFGRQSRLRVSGLFRPARSTSRNVVSWEP